MGDPVQAQNDFQNAWQHQIRKELKLEADTALAREIEPGIFLDPSLTEKQVPEVLSINWPEHPWLTGMQITVADPFEANVQLKLALQHGVQSLWMVLHQKMELPDFQRLFAGIHLELITMFIEPAEEAHAVDTWRELDQFLSLQDELPASGGFFFPGDGDGGWQTLDWQDLLQRYPGWYWIKMEPTWNYNFVDRLTSILEQVNRMTTSRPSHAGSIDDWLSRFLVVWPGDNRILAHLAATRALHLLWQQLFHSRTPPLTVLGCIGEETFTADANINLIRSAAMATTLALSGIHSMYITPAEAESNFYRRLAVNIQQLLQLESHLAPKADLIAGSYVLDDLTSQFVAAAWRQWQRVL